MTRAAIYCRVSTDTQRDNYSVPSQIQACLEYAESKGYMVVGDWLVDPGTGLDSGEGVTAFVDDISSSEANRPALEAAYAFAASQGFDVLVTHSIDRMARSAGMLELLETQFQELDVRVEYVLGGYEESAEGDLLKEMVAVMAKFENVKRTERSTRGKKQKAKSGLIVGQPAYGYIKHEGGIGGVVVVPGEAEIINRIFKLFINGASIRGIAKRLNAEGVRSPRGGNWGKSSIAKILNREVYTGKAIYNRTKRVGKRQVENPKDEWIEIPVPAIISNTTFIKAAEILKHNKQFRRAQPKRFYLLSGLVYCSECGKPYMSETAPAGKNRRKNDYKYYRHRGANQGCENHQISAQKVDDSVLEIFHEFTSDVEAIQIAFENYIVDLKAQDASKYTQLERLEDEINRASSKRERYVELYSDGLISKSELETTLYAVDEKAKNLKDRRDSIETIHLPSVNDLREIEDFITAYKDDVDNLRIGDIRQALLDLNARVAIKPKSGITEFEILPSRGLLSKTSIHCDLRPRQLRGHVSHVPDPGSRHNLCLNTYLQEPRLAVQLSRFE